MTKYFKYAFAEQGDNVAVPDTQQSSGGVSYQQGFGYDYQRKLGEDPLAKPVPRQQSNQLYNDITGAIKQYQENGVFDFITPEMNGGTPFAYAMGACVRYDLSDAQDGAQINIYASKIANNTGNPKDNPNDWQNISTLSFATTEEAQAGTATDKIISPASLAGVFSNSSLKTSGYQVLPGGLILQWLSVKHNDLPNEAKVDFTFPIPFNNTLFVFLSSSAGYPMRGVTTEATEGASILSYDNAGGVILSAWNRNPAGAFSVLALGT